MRWPFARRAAPAPIAVAEPRRISISLSDLNRRARAAVVAERHQRRTADLRADVAQGRSVTMRPRSEVVADIVARRASTKRASA